MKLWPFERFAVTLDQPSDRFVETIGAKLASSDLFEGFTEGRTFVATPKGKKSRYGQFLFYGTVSDAGGQTRIDIQLKDPLLYYRLAGMLIFPALVLAALIYRTLGPLHPLPPAAMALAITGLIAAVATIYGPLLRNYHKARACKDRLIETLRPEHG